MTFPTFSKMPSRPSCQFSRSMPKLLQLFAHDWIQGKVPSLQPSSFFINSLNRGTQREPIDSGTVPKTKAQLAKEMRPVGEDVRRRSLSADTKTGSLLSV